MQLSALVCDPLMVPNDTGRVERALLLTEHPAGGVILTSSEVLEHLREFPAAVFELALWQSDASVVNVGPGGAFVRMSELKKRASFQTGALAAEKARAALAGIAVTLLRVDDPTSVFGPNCEINFKNIAGHITFAALTNTCRHSHIMGEA